MGSNYTSKPKATRITKNGVEFLDCSDQAMYYIETLIACALTDVAKYIAIGARNKLPKRTGRARKNVQYWVRKKELDLQIGYKWRMKSGNIHAGWYAHYFELGTEGTPKLSPIYSTVAESIDTIVKIQTQYLSALKDPEPKMPVLKESDLEPSE